jgi:hypothetical protein
VRRQVFVNVEHKLARQRRLALRHGSLMRSVVGYAMSRVGISEANRLRLRSDLLAVQVFFVHYCPNHVKFKEQFILRKFFPDFRYESSGLGS